MKKQKDEQPDIVESIKQKTSPEDHTESFCPEWNRSGVTAIACSSSYYGNITIKSAYCFCHFQNSLIVADAVCD